MTNREMTLITLIKLLEDEVQCLRSVLSEYDEDKSHFVQMKRADILRAAIETLEYKV